MERDYTNMLIIGNGFDLAHERPTTYSNFLLFLELILEIRNYNRDKKYVEEYLDNEYDKLCPTVKEYLLSSFDTRLTTENGYTRNTNIMVQELYDRLENNAWYDYLQRIHQENEIHGKNWIDFEGEIREVIEFFDRKIGDLYAQLPESLTSPQRVPIKIAYFSKRLDFSQYNQINKKSDSYKNTYYDLIEKTYQDLKNLIRCLEIYLGDCVCKMPISCYSPDIQNLTIDSILSFNYTEIPTNVYPSLLKVHKHQIHGSAKAGRLAKDNNMVLGVDEYWEASEKDFRTNFNAYKKFVQRIIKGTGIDYKKVLGDMSAKHNRLNEMARHINQRAANKNHVYIFGHSLDITDGDILREVIQTPGVVTTIFYRDKRQQANQIANLSKVLSQDELLKRVFSVAPTIVFKEQAKMVPR